jgi:two-component system cell cycle response regulator DivK
MDIQLPGINGIEAFRQIRGEATTARIPVVALSAAGTPTDRSAITAAGFDAFVGKPINLKEFLETVKRLIEAGRK